MGRLKTIAQDHNLLLIEDAAEAHGAEISGQRVGSIGLAGIFSFYENKIVTTGERGMVTTNDAQLAKLARRLRDDAFHSERHFWLRRGSPAMSVITSTNAPTRTGYGR